VSYQFPIAAKVWKIVCGGGGQIQRFLENESLKKIKIKL